MKSESLTASQTLHNYPVLPICAAVTGAVRPGRRTWLRVEQTSLATKHLHTAHISIHRNGLANGIGNLSESSHQTACTPARDTTISLHHSNINSNEPRNIRCRLHWRWSGWPVTRLSTTRESIYQGPQNRIDRRTRSDNISEAQRPQRLFQSMFLPHSFIGTILARERSMAAHQCIKNAAIPFDGCLGWREWEQDSV